MEAMTGSWTTDNGVVRVEGDADEGGDDDVGDGTDTEYAWCSGSTLLSVAVAVKSDGAIVVTVAADVGEDSTVATVDDEDEGEDEVVDDAKDGVPASCVKYIGPCCCCCCCCCCCWKCIHAEAGIYTQLASEPGVPVASTGTDTAEPGGTVAAGVYG